MEIDAGNNEDTSAIRTERRRVEKWAKLLNGRRLVQTPPAVSSFDSEPFGLFTGFLLLLGFLLGVLLLRCCLQPRVEPKKETKDQRDLEYMYERIAMIV